MARCFLGLLIGTVALVAGVGLIDQGLYGITLFVLLPVLIGGLSSWMCRPTSAGHAARIGAGGATVALFCFLVAGLEGVICIIMTLPLAAPLGALGGWMVYRSARNVAILLLLPPAGIPWDIHAQPPMYEVRTAITIASTPEQVWKHVVAFPDLPEPQEWYFRAGLAYPKRARIEGSGTSAIRYCDFSTGPFVEPIEVWNEPNLLRFRVTENPAPMQEWSPYAKVLPKHLHGYLISKRGQFRLTRLADNRTLLEGTTWYQHGLAPAEYWRWWSDAVIHRIHLRVLNHIRGLAEAADPESSGARP